MSRYFGYVLLIVFAVAILSGWWIDHRRLAQQIASQAHLQPESRPAVERVFVAAPTFGDVLFWDPKSSYWRVQCIELAHDMEEARQHDPNLLKRPELDFNFAQHGRWLELLPLIQQGPLDLQMYPTPIATVPMLPPPIDFSAVSGRLQDSQVLHSGSAPAIDPLQHLYEERELPQAITWKGAFSLPATPYPEQLERRAAEYSEAIQGFWPLTPKS